MKKILLTVFVLFFSTSFTNAETITQFTSSVGNREPADNIKSVVKEGVERIIFYSAIEGQEGNTVYHVWKNGENEIYKQTIKVGSPKWRVWSSVLTDHFEVGDKATVEIQSEEGEVLTSNSVNIE